MIVKVKRQDNSSSKPYYQSFNFKANGILNVSKILEDLNYLDDLKDINGNIVRRISYECSCNQKMCGACAMLVNNQPCLACAKFINTDKTKTLTLEPLSKFNVVCDLIVDRSIISEYQKNAKLYIDSLNELNQNEYEHQYEASKCLKCGLCLEACPNYKKESSKFYGAMFANDAYLKYTLSKNNKGVLNEYHDHFAAYCSKALSCKTVCPMHMPTLSSIAFMNKQKQ